MNTPPKRSEYGDNYEKYVSRVKDSDIAELLLSQVDELRFVVEQMNEEMAKKPYAPNKWTYKELLGHINDTEKIMFFRALCFARKEKQALPGFDQDDYVEAADFNAIPLPHLMDDFLHIRHSIAYFLKHLSEEASMYQGSANGQPTSVRSLLYIIAGHFEHHMDVLKEIAQKTENNS